MKALLLAVSLILVRHAEKADASKDSALSAAGEARAQALAVKLRDAGITSIWTTDLKRTQQTARPLADALHLTPHVLPAKDTAALIAALRAEKGRALVVGHTNTLPEVAQAFGAKIELGEPDFDLLFVIAAGESFKLHQ
jgi:phosphohistidine phosphatase SixA